MRNSYVWVQWIVHGCSIDFILISDRLSIDVRLNLINFLRTISARQFPLPFFFGLYMGIKEIKTD